MVYTVSVSSQHALVSLGEASAADYFTWFTNLLYITDQVRPRLYVCYLGH